MDHAPRNIRFKKAALLLFLSMMAAGCGSSSKTTTSSASGTLSGNWQFTLQPSNKGYRPTQQSGFLVDDSGTLTGSLMFNDISCSGVGNVTGSVSGSNVEFTLAPAGITMEFTGSFSLPGSMSGTYTILSSGCGGTYSAPQNGTWTASLVTPINGTIAAGSIFTSNESVAYSVSGQLAQGTNTGISSTTLSGNLIASDYCFFSAVANVTGDISGTSLALNLLDANGNQIGWVTGTTNLTGNSVTGTYHMAGLGIGTGIVPPCINGDSGTVQLNF